jgi:hypothetical protein
MDYKLLAISALAAGSVLFVAGLCVSLLSTYMQCSKTSFATSLKWGFISSIAPTLAYTLAAAVLLVRRSFSETFKSFGVASDTSEIMGVGYITLLIGWITMVQNIHRTEKEVCQTSVKEMSAFKKKLMAELAEKEHQKEASAKK